MQKCVETLALPLKAIFLKNGNTVGGTATFWLYPFIAANFLKTAFDTANIKIGCTSSWGSGYTLFEDPALLFIWQVLSEHPVIDGHNDFPMGVRDVLNNDVSKLNFDHDLTKVGKLHAKIFCVRNCGFHGLLMGFRIIPNSVIIF